ncbi:MAG: zinc ABC transporter substrate-binding protein [Acidimicrobiales bacterium]
MPVPLPVPEAVPAPARPRRGGRGRAAAAVSALVVAIGLAACSSSGPSSGSSSASAGSGSSERAAAPGTTAPPCPTTPVRVVVSIDPWGDVVRRLGGACAEVTTIVTGTAGDPHEYEPTPRDRAAIGDAGIVVVDGLGYDAWATKAVEASSPAPTVVDAGAVMGRAEGDNPHLWYEPDAVGKVSAAVSGALRAKAPAASAYFDERAAAWDQALAPYEQAVADARAVAAGRPYAATESVFAPMADALGMRDVTPEGYRRAAANESEPAPGDIADFQQVLRSRQAAVLVFNTQTEGAVPDQLRDVAEQAGVPVVEVTEAVPSGAPSFVDWQVAQLAALRRALGG